MFLFVSFVSVVGSALDKGQAGSYKLPGRTIDTPNEPSRATHGT